ncbi:Helix-turn-helix domain-containing protein [Chitinophaga sp. YR627]|uniref:helix-turn-helix domain-containing protein n=1 Tax=Chitinophaga sp. YR627 TaxID=1881041 RepID=UPI0008E26197|nr:helix-turn-helix transcriptional regulator [Chitinophaga sp. YR627]SFM73785.1 Helix-turn-helix domain-containing protein [Chitinophaga sp. YR627]
MGNKQKQLNYKAAIDTIPDSFRKEIGRFNVFFINHDNDERFDGELYGRKGLYKISLLKGNTKLFYADKNIEFEKYALLFSNPNIPYSWEFVGSNHTSFFCVFTESFIDQFGMIKTYPVFMPGNYPLFELTDTQFISFEKIFLEMQQEIRTDFPYKYDVLRTKVLELIHAALRLQPAEPLKITDTGGSKRIASLFTELLERQFPIESTQQQMEVRRPADFADNLSVHVNHLNRALKETTGRTTSQLIAERIHQEAKSLLLHTEWSIAEIAWCLGFEELSNFINFFKRVEKLPPKSFRTSNKQ